MPGGAELPVRWLSMGKDIQKLLDTGEFALCLCGQDKYPAPHYAQR